MCMGIMLVIAIVATIRALIQNSLMFAFGMKEMAIASSPVSFVGILFLEIASIGATYFFIGRFLRRNRELVLAGCTILIMGVTEFALQPASSLPSSATPKGDTSCNASRRSALGLSR
jgi:hypothetical protein